ncbi:hypothetical protein SAMN05443661_11678 [Natronobacterium gregoryi]|uniref:Uncharacterized protein n=1 Tax=Natronobacterium gregoryi TaxID=44930 RepID=A0A1I3P8X1_9EURY|nr:hypothetical protein SAMN05443661_11678 [Natronobacterium gregoryi]
MTVDRETVPLTVSQVTETISVDRQLEFEQPEIRVCVAAGPELGRRRVDVLVELRLRRWKHRRPVVASQIGWRRRRRESLGSVLPLLVAVEKDAKGEPAARERGFFRVEKLRLVDAVLLVAHPGDCRQSFGPQQVDVPGDRPVEYRPRVSGANRVDLDAKRRPAARSRRLVDERGVVSRNLDTAVVVDHSAGWHLESRIFGEIRYHVQNRESTHFLEAVEERRNAADVRPGPLAFGSTHGWRRPPSWPASVRYRRVTAFPRS